MAMHLVWKGRQLIIYLFNTVWILLISKVVFSYMYMYSVCSCFYVCSCVWVCVHVCVDAQSQLWMSTQLLYFIYWGGVSCWPWSSLLPVNGVSWPSAGIAVHLRACSYMGSRARLWSLMLAQKAYSVRHMPSPSGFGYFVVADVVLHSNISNNCFLQVQTS